MGLSREGLSIARWAALHPGKTARLYTDKAVCDFKSWPGGKLGTGKGSPKDWENLLPLYGFANESEALAYCENPVDLAPELAADGVAIVYVGGTKDAAVPSERNRPGGRRSTSIQLNGKPVVFEPPMVDSFSVLNVEVRNLTAPPEIESIDAHFVSQPVACRGAFACSDEKLTRLWEALRRNVQVCLQTRHRDSPDHQEPLGDAGDYLVQSVANWQAFHAPALVRQDVRKIAWIMRNSGYQMFHTSYQLLWLQMLVEYHQHTADAELVRELASYTHELIAQFLRYRGQNGLLSNAPDYIFMDFKKVGGMVCHHPPAVIGQGYLTAFFHRALQDARRVAEIAGEPSKREYYRGLARDLSEALNRELWCLEKSLYRDVKPFQSNVTPHQWLPADTQIETFSPHLNLLAVLYGIAPPERHTSIGETIVTPPAPLEVSPYFYYFTLPALVRAGLFP